MEVHTFTHEKFGQIRAVADAGRVWYCGVDVSRGVEFKQYKIAVRAHTFADECKLFVLPDKHNYPQETKCIKEACVYRLILYSSRKSLQQYERWFTHTVVKTMKGFEAQ